LVVRSVVRNLVHHVAVTFNGAIIEQGDADRFAEPPEPYTQRLPAAVPQPSR
jgi:peptide/nickel transport system ATP-binding protein